MSPILSLSTAGYRRLGPLPSGGGGLTAERAATTAADTADYDIAGPWVRRHGRAKTGRAITSFQLVDVFDKDTTLSDGRLGFIDDYFRSEFATTGPHLTTETENILDAVRSLGEERRPLGMYRVEQSLALAGSQRLRPLFRDHIAPAFFHLYPKGKVAVVRYDLNNDKAAALLRVFYAAAQTPLQNLQQSNFSGIRTLQEWHLNSLTMLGPVLFDIFLYLFYPFVGGYRGGPVGLDFIFLFEPAEMYAPDLYPRNWLAVASTAASFGRERVDLTEALREFQGAAWQRAAHQRFQHPSGYPVGDRLTLLKWYLERVNSLLYELADAANFTEGHATEAAIDPVFGFEHYLTVDRLIRKTLLAMTLEDVGTAKHLAFEVADLYEGLSARFGNHSGANEFFKRLFNTQEGPSLVRERLSTLPAPLGTALPTLADGLYTQIEDAIVRSVWMTAKVTAGGVLVRNKDLSQEECLTRPAFVAELMRVYRNAHHGYFSADPASQNRPSRFLFQVDGNLPVELSALPALWWLAYLADPRMVGWRPLPTQAFD